MLPMLCRPIVEKQCLLLQVVGLQRLLSTATGHYRTLGEECYGISRMDLLLASVCELPFELCALGLIRPHDTLLIQESPPLHSLPFSPFSSSVYTVSVRSNVSLRNLV